jgi:hypothetical protein
MMPEGVAAPARKPRRDNTLIKALVRAHRWRRRIETGSAKSITDLAEQEGVADGYAARFTPEVNPRRTATVDQGSVEEQHRPRWPLQSGECRLAR